MVPVSMAANAAVSDTNMSPVLIRNKSKAVISVTVTIPLHRVLRGGAIKVA